jgi:hypothetical protein
MCKNLKKVLLGLLFIVLISSLVRAEDGPGSFKGIPWGSEMGQGTEFIILREIRDFRFCSRSGEVPEIDGAQVEEIRYEFFKNRFYSVMVRFSGDRNFRLLVEGLSRRYGAAEKITKYMEEYEWSSHDLNVILKYSDSEKNGSLEYQYKPIFDQITRQENC